MDLFFEPHIREALREGRFEFAYGLHPLLALLVLAALGGLVWFFYRRTTRAVDPFWKRIMVGLRVAAVLLIVLILMRPAVTTWQVDPQQAYLAVLIDDSESMSIADQNGQTRLERVRERLYGNDGLIAPLSELYQVRVFRFDRHTGRVASADDLQAGGSDSWIGASMDAIDNQLRGLPLGAVLLISDGAETGGVDPVAAAQRFAARDVPVFTMGVGQEQLARDIGIVSVQVDETILDDAIYNVQLTLSQSGYEGESVELRIRDEDDVVASQTVRLGPDGTERRYEMELQPQRREPIVYELEVDLMPDEAIPENNRYRFLVDNSERPPLNILYVDGYPRNEFKFIRRAADIDDNLRLASYLQTGPGRFYRQGLESSLELSGGFPSTREELYQYEALVIGGVNRDFFSNAQIGLIQDFVAERGGGLLVSGLLEDTFAESRLADVLPLTLVRSSQLPSFLQGGTRRGNHATGETFTPRLTREGELSAMLQLHSDDTRNRQQWQELPDLQGVYVTGRPKPGASVLMEHPSLQYQGQAAPIMATQRYGSGRSLFITTASTWRWQMLMHSTDDSHERLWRQMLRWLAVSAPERVRVDFDREYYHAGDEVTVTATVRDERFEPDNNASLWLQLTDPTGQVTDMPMEWYIEEDGVYRSRFTVEQEGIYRTLVDVASASDIEAEQPAAFVVTPSLREYNDPTRDSGLLRRVAQASGGQYHDLDASDRLLADIEYTPGAHSRERRQDLWDRPFFLFLLIALLSADWALRRQKGLS